MATFFTDADLSGSGETAEAEVWLSTEMTIPAGTVVPRWRFPAVASGVTPVIRIFDAGGSAVTPGGTPLSFLTSTNDAWNSTSGVTLAAGTYRFTVNTTRYVFKLSFFSGGSITRGSITAVQSRFGSPGSAPTSTSTATYFVDIDFTASGGSTPISAGDTASGSETAAVATSAPLADAASAADAATLTAAAPLSQAGSSTETLATAAVISLADGGSAADSLSNGAGTPTGVADAGSGADALAVTVSASLADAASAAQLLTAAAAAALTDAATAVETAALAVAAGLADGGTAGQSLATAAALALGDAAAGSDAGAGSDNSNVQKALADSGTAVEQLRLRTLRPSSGTTARPGAGTTTRPSAGVTPRP